MDAAKIAEVYNRAYDIEWNLSLSSQGAIHAGVTAVAEWARREALKEVAAARSDAPKCDIYDDNEPVSCGWKRTVQTIDGILAEVK